uniref:BSD domain-containing protein n=1 Tax=Auxenochlorella protothecoides TaxID=3075 RepID=A0A1D1ZT29_AUXPR
MPSDACFFTRPARQGTSTSSPPGTCSIYATRLAWSPADRAIATPALVELAAVTRTQQAPNKPFIRLEWPTGTLVLGFESVSDRDEAVDLIKKLRAKLLASSTPPPGVPSAPQKAAYFAQDRDLEKLYLELVVPGILPEQEFWAARASHLARLGSGAGASASGHRTASSSQRRGLPNSLTSEVRPAADGQTDTVHFSLTPEIIAQIFNERPEVHRAFLAKVPHELNEKEFWTVYFKEQYKRLARRRKGLGPDEEDFEDEVFGPFRRQIALQEAARARGRMQEVDPTLNLEAAQGEQYAMLQRSEGAEAGLGAAGYLAKDLNRHAALVLEGTPEGVLDLAGDGDGPSSHDTAAIATRLAASQAGASRTAAREPRGEPLRHRDHGLEDLRGPEQAPGIPLNIRDPAAYYRAGAPAVDGAATPESEPMSTLRDPGDHTPTPLSAVLRSIDPTALPLCPCDPALARAVLEELSAGTDAGLAARFGALAAGVHGVRADAALPPGLLGLLRDEALRTDELLRHFWGALPWAAPAAGAAAEAERAAREARAGRLVGALEAQRARLRAHAAVAPGTIEHVYAGVLLQPCEEGIQAAVARHKEEVAASIVLGKAVRA